MSHARIEEVEDSSPNASDPSEGNISDVASDFDDRDILKRRVPASSTGPSQANASILSPSALPQPLSSSRLRAPGDQDKFKNFACIYPLYFDKNRSRKHGRRVGVKGAVENPLARGIVDACGRLGLEVCFEPMKVHPRDWANPGRVRVDVKGGKGIKNKHHLYTLISEYLIANPTTEETAIRVQIPGLPPPDPKKPYPKPAVPKGWKMGTILPYYGSAISGDGISENLFKDMMTEMHGDQGGNMPGMGGMPGMMEGLMGSMGTGEGSSRGPNGQKARS